MTDKVKNIEEIKLLFPDYILGRLNEQEVKAVEDAINNSDELKLLLEEMGGTFNFLGNVKFTEPEPQYWQTLLPRIHQRLEEAEEKRFSWDKLAVYWKFVIPAAAVILIAIFYFAILNKSNDSTITKKENKEKIIDTSKSTEKKEEIKKETVKEENNVDNKKSNHDRYNDNKHKILKDIKEQFTDSKDNEIKKTDEIKKEDFINNDIESAINLEEESILVGGAGGIDDEMDRELNMLSNKEQELLIEELSKSNL